MKKQLRFALTLFTLSIIFHAPAQVWNTVGNGLSSAPFVGHQIKTANDGANLYVACMPTPNFITNGTEVFKWNGSFWTTSPKLFGFNVRGVEAINGTVVVIGFNSSGSAIFRLDNSGWTDITPAGMTGAMFNITKHNGSFVITGSFSTTAGYEDIVRYDGTNYFAYPPLPRITYVYDAAVFQGDLYVSGQDSFNGAPLDSILYSYNSGLNIWESKLNFIQGTGNSQSPKKIMASSNQMYLYDFYHVMNYDNDTATYISSLSHMVNEYVEYNNNLYVVGTQQPGQSNMSVINGNTIIMLWHKVNHNGTTDRNLGRTTMHLLRFQMDATMAQAQKENPPRTV